MKRLTFTFTGMVDAAHEHGAVYLTTEQRNALLAGMKEHGITDATVQVSVIKPKEKAAAVAEPVVEFIRPHHAA